jgi:hypothetical protein
MQVSEEQRRELYDRVRAHLDDETAALLLEMTVPANVELATRGDVQEFRAEMLLGFAQLDGRMVSIDSRLSERITGVEQRLAGIEQRLAGIDERITGIDERITGVESSIVGLAPTLLKEFYTVGIPIIGVIVTVIVGIGTWVGVALR